jgi:hypothetical protein
MKDARSRRMVVVEGRHTNAGLTRRYMRRGYGMIQIPDLSVLDAPSSDYLLTVAADEVQEFLRDKEKVIVLKGRSDRWVRLLLRKLSARRVPVETRELA